MSEIDEPNDMGATDEGGDRTLRVFRDFLREMWSDNTEDEAILLWKRRIKRTPGYVHEALAALDAVIANPPANLVELMQEDGWINLYHREDPAAMTRFSFDEYLDWLKAMTERFRTIYKEERSAD